MNDNQVQVYIGTETKQKVSTAVLKHSILRRTKRDVKFNEMSNLQIGLTQKMFTGFSFYRFGIPQMMKYKGRAIYSDTDIMYQADIAELYDMDMHGHGALARMKTSENRFTSVMLLDCEKLTNWDFDKLVKHANRSRVFYTEIMWAVEGSWVAKDFGDLPPEWNHLDVYVEGATKALHYTNVPTQPWTYPKHKHRDVFLKEMRAALDSGYITENFVKENLRHLYPDILKDCHATATRS